MLDLRVHTNKGSTTWSSAATDIDFDVDTCLLNRGPLKRCPFKRRPLKRCPLKRHLLKRYPLKRRPLKRRPLNLNPIESIILIGL